MYTSGERVVRDGRLVAFEGEEMTDQEAEARGLAATGDAERAEEPEKVEEPEKTDAEDEPEGPAEATPKQARPRRKPRQGQE